MSDEQITSILYTVLTIMIFILVVLVIFFIYFGLKMRSKSNNNKAEKNRDNKEEKDNKEKLNEKYNKQSIYSFMDFDKIEDNMIERKNGKKFVMVVECQGINYDLMSGVEKSGVEQGFLQFLNTLRYPIQIYVQTRTVNLEKSLSTYRGRLREIEDKLVSEQMEYNSRVNSGQYTEEELERQRIEVVKERNLYEYGKDIIENTERMNLNRNILSKHYYLVIDYTPEEVETQNYGKDEIANMAFSELYTKAQAAISSLSVCGINSKILSSNELVELLYMAYNRDEAEVFGLDKVLKSGYDELYSTAQDVLDKKMKALDKKIEEDGIRKANEALVVVTEERAKEREVKRKEEELSSLIRKMAKDIIDENEGILGKELSEAAKTKIDKEEEETANDEKDKKRKRRATKRV